jgi:hypothetical protein
MYTYIDNHTHEHTHTHTQRHTHTHIEPGHREDRDAIAPSDEHAEDLALSVREKERAIEGAF